MDEKTTQIEKERFDSVRSLSEVQLALSDARVAFEKLKNSEAEYLKEREDKVVKHLNSLEKSLKESFEGFLENKETFEKFKGIVSSFAEKANTMAVQLEETSKMVSEKLQNVDDFIEAKMTKLKDDSARLLADRKFLNEELEQLSKRKRELEEDQKRLNNEKIAFEEKWQDLNK